MIQGQVLSVKDNSRIEESFGRWSRKDIKNSSKWVAQLREKMSTRDKLRNLPIISQKECL